jgi:hypothetical protein
VPDLPPKTIALKYCGGCDPAFDRVQYFQRIRDAAPGAVQWVALDEGGFSTVLIISGCETACPERTVDLKLHRISIRDDQQDPGAIMQNLLRGRK